MTDTTTTTDTATRPWLDASRPVDERVQLLLDEMTIEEKAGLFFHTMIAIGDLDEPNPIFRTPSARDFLEKKQMTHFNLLGAAPTGREIAAWQNAVQRLAASTRLGIPVTLSTDPRHSFSENPGASILAGPFSQWPETLGLAATRDAELVERFADIARQEYRPSACASPCTRRSTSPPSPAGRGRRRRSVRTPSCRECSAPPTSAASRGRHSGPVRSRP